MNYQQTLAYIMEQLPMYQRIGKSAYRSGLENTEKMDDYFNHPHTRFKTVHVAGTNGKGSVSHMLASALQEEGYITGLYTSPHLVDFRERIKVNGKMISKKFVTSFISKHKSFFKTFDPSFFEISVFMAFEYFAMLEVDIAVIEVGLGGRLDATNIIRPELSVITNIGKDHTEILGNTLKLIATEKAGIIKHKVPVIIGESHPETLPVFLEISQNRNAPLMFADDIFRIDYSLLSVDGYQVFNVKKNGEIHYTNLKCGLLGHYQRKNTATVLCALEQLGISEKSVFSGIRKVVTNTGLSGRWQIIQSHPLVICDTAHNADGIKVVLNQVKETSHRNLHLVMGFVNDKDIQQIIKLLPSKATYYFTRLSVPRTMNEEDLAREAGKSGLKGQPFAHVKEAVSAAKKNAAMDDLILVTGSNFLVADFISNTL